MKTNRRRGTALPGEILFPKKNYHTRRHAVAGGTFACNGRGSGGTRDEPREASPVRRSFRRRPSPHGAERDCRLPPGWDSSAVFRPDNSGGARGLARCGERTHGNGITGSMAATGAEGPEQAVALRGVQQTGRGGDGGGADGTFQATRKASSVPRACPSMAPNECLGTPGDADAGSAFDAVARAAMGAHGLLVGRSAPPLALPQPTRPPLAASDLRHRSATAPASRHAKNPAAGAPRCRFSASPDD
jgi:hypothetical protein